MKRDLYLANTQIFCSKIFLGSGLLSLFCTLFASHPTEQFADVRVVKERVFGDLLEHLFGAVFNGLLEFSAEILVHLLLIQLEIVAVDLEEVLVDLDIDIGKVETEALQLAGVVELLQGDHCWLELLLQVV